MSAIIKILSATVLLTDGADEILLKLDLPDPGYSFEGSATAKITAARDKGEEWVLLHFSILPEVKDTRTKQNSMNGDVHTRHCCLHCGCKYGEDVVVDEITPVCSVTTGRKQQESECSGDCFGR